MKQLSPGVLYILIINIAVFVLGYVLKGVFNVDLDDFLALYYIKSEHFKPLQFLTYMFVHGGFMHIFFNMFALVMFGNVVEMIWGTKRFVMYYLMCGLGAAIINMIINYYQMQPIYETANAFFDNPCPDSLVAFAHCTNSEQEMSLMQIATIWEQGNCTQADLDSIFSLVQKMAEFITARPIVGASGAIFGVLLAFGMMFPDQKLYFLFIPIGIPAKYCLIIYGLIELFFGVKDFEFDNIAHFAHLGGMLVGFLLILWWRRHPNNNIYN